MQTNSPKINSKINRFLVNTKLKILSTFHNIKHTFRNLYYKNNIVVNKENYSSNVEIPNQLDDSINKVINNNIYNLIQIDARLKFIKEIISADQNRIQYLPTDICAFLSASILKDDAIVSQLVRNIDNPFMTSEEKAEIIHLHNDLYQLLLTTSTIYKNSSKHKEIFYQGDVEKNINGETNIIPEEENLQKVRQENYNLAKENNDLRQKLNDLQRKYEVEKECNISNTTEISKMRVQYCNLEKNIAKLKQELDDKQLIIKQHTVQIDTESKWRNQAEHFQAALQKTIEQNGVLQNQIDVNNNNYIQEIKTLQKSINDLIQEKRDLLEKYDKLHHEHTELTTNYDSIMNNVTLQTINNQKQELIGEKNTTDYPKYNNYTESLIRKIKLRLGVHCRDTIYSTATIKQVVNEYTDKVNKYTHLNEELNGLIQERLSLAIQQTSLQSYADLIATSNEISRDINTTIEINAKLTRINELDKKISQITYTITKLRYDIRLTDFEKKFDDYQNHITNVAHESYKHLADVDTDLTNIKRLMDDQANHDRAHLSKIKRDGSAFTTPTPPKTKSYEQEQDYDTKNLVPPPKVFSSVNQRQLLSNMGGAAFSAMFKKQNSTHTLLESQNKNKSNTIETTIQ